MTAACEPLAAATRGIEQPSAVHLVLDVYGERRSVLTDRIELARQIVNNFGTMVVEAEPRPRDTPSDLQILCSPGTPLARQWQLFSEKLAAALVERFLLLHAAAVALDGRSHRGGAPPTRRACLFVGAGGSGKTTLSLAAAQRGHTLLGDDLVALDWHTARLLAMPFPLRPRPDIRRTLGPAVARLCRRPVPTDPAEAPTLVRAILLETNRARRRARPRAVVSLLQAVHAGHGVPTRTLLHHLLRGMRHADVLSVARLPPLGCSLQPQARMCESLFRGAPAAPTSGEAS